MAEDAAPASPAAGEGAPASALGETSARVLARVVERMGGSRREGQERMVAEIARTLEAGDHLMVQAGTGTGKSVGYLVPLLTRCALEGSRALVTTATLALQRQILVKDAPAVVDAVAEVTGVRPEVALLKGWANYLCLQKVRGGDPGVGALFELDDEEDGPGVSGPGRATTSLGREVLRLREWAATTSTGDRDDLSPGVSDRAWRQVSVQRRECPGRACPMVEECFPQAAREAAAEADLVVSNHTMLGIHATGEGDLFPGVDAVVVDEAHELAERVRDQASVMLSAAEVERLARRTRSAVRIDTSSLEEASAALGACLEEVEDGLVDARPERLEATMRVLDAAVRDGLTQVQQSSEEAPAKQAARAHLDELMAAVDAWSRPAERSITWVERPWRDGEVLAPRLMVAPLDVAGPIGTVALGDRPAVLTSATLTLGGSFEPLAVESGLMVSGVPWRGVDVGSPFDAARQGISYVAAHLPPPSPAGPRPEHLDELVALVEASGGGALVLFSSWRGVEAGAAALRERTDLEVLVHGEETVTALVERFRSHRDSVLVGTMSLWQGVDVVGPSCRLVVIDRIPFPRPDDPVARARARDAERRGASGFRAVHLSHAALLMAQASGRLLRSGEDRGMVAVLDQRLVSKGYGAFIRASMPSMWPTTDRSVALGALERLRASLD